MPTERPEMFHSWLDKTEPAQQHVRRQEEGREEGREETRGLRRRFTNRENRLARQLLDHIRTETKWTSGVDRPFVLGI